jgi:hypothetical protein
MASPPFEYRVALSRARKNNKQKIFKQATSSNHTHHKALVPSEKAKEINHETEKPKDISYLLIHQITSANAARVQSIRENITNLLRNHLITRCRFTKPAVAHVTPCRSMTPVMGFRFTTSSTLAAHGMTSSGESCIRLCQWDLKRIQYLPVYEVEC